MNIQELRLWIHRMEDVEKATVIIAYEQHGVVILEAQDEHSVVETLEVA